jgi:hypothetical protein
LLKLLILIEKTRSRIKVSIEGANVLCEIHPRFSKFQQFPFELMRLAMEEASSMFDIELKLYGADEMSHQIVQTR